MAISVWDSFSTHSPASVPTSVLSFFPILMIEGNAMLYATLCNKAVMVLIESPDQISETIKINERSCAWRSDAHLDVVRPIRDVL